MKYGTLVIFPLYWHFTILIRNILVARDNTLHQSHSGIKYNLMVTLIRKFIILADFRCGQTLIMS